MIHVWIIVSVSTSALTTMPRPDPSQCRRMKTAIAAEVGNIQGMAERFIAESNDYLINKIPQATYDPSLGEDPIKVRYSSAPIEEREYVEILVSGEENGSMDARNCGGSNEGINTSINRKGAYGCNLPGQTLHGGYDVFQRVLKGKAFETEPVCALDLILKAHYNDYIRMLRNDLPKRAVEHFGYSLERNVIEFAQYNTACVNGFVTAAGAFPAAPEGCLDLATVRRTFAILEAQGWTGAREIHTSHAAFETMRLNYKNNTGLTLEATLVSSETQYLDGDTQAVDWAGIRWVLSKRPTRGYLRTDGAGNKVFVPVRPTRARAGTGAGVVVDINEDYFDCETYCDGERHELYEVGFYVHPTAAHRESFAIPQVADKRFSNSMFNFEVRMIDGAYIDCNVDNLKFFFRLMHAYAFESTMPELMGAIIYRVQPDVIYVNAPAGCNRPCDLNPVEVAPALPQQLDACSYADRTDDCAGDVAQALLPVPTQDDPIPAPAAGLLRFVNVSVITETDAGSLKVWVERVGGVDGAATVTLDAATGGVANVDGTAVAATDFTDPGTVVLSWADGEAGRKSYTVPILAGGAGGVWFSVKRTLPTGATWSGDTNIRVDIDTACDVP